MEEIDGPKVFVSPLTPSQEIQRQATKDMGKMDTIVADEQDDQFSRYRSGSVSQGRRKRNKSGVTSLREKDSSF